MSKRLFLEILQAPFVSVLVMRAYVGALDCWTLPYRCQRRRHLKLSRRHRTLLHQLWDVECNDFWRNIHDSLQGDQMASASVKH